MTPVDEAIKAANHWNWKAEQSVDAKEVDENRQKALFTLMKAILVEIAGLREDIARRPKL